MNFLVIVVLLIVASEIEAKVGEDCDISTPCDSGECCVQKSGGSQTCHKLQEKEGGKCAMKPIDDISNIYKHCCPCSDDFECEKHKCAKK